MTSMDHPNEAQAVLVVEWSERWAVWRTLLGTSSGLKCSADDFCWTSNTCFPAAMKEGLSSYTFGLVVIGLDDCH